MRQLFSAFAVLSILATAGTPSHANNTPVPTAALADLQVRATAVTFSVGLPGRYSISIVNKGPNATDAPVTLSTTLPAGLSFLSISSDWICSSSGQDLSCSTSDSIAAQSTLTVVLAVNVDSNAVPRVTTVLTVSYGGDTNPANNSALRTTSVRGFRGPTFTATPTRHSATPTSTSVTPIVGTATRTPSRTSTPSPAGTATATRTPQLNATDVKLGKTTFGPFTVGSDGTYTLTVTNLGPLATNGLMTVIDSLPAPLGYVSATGTGWTCDAMGQIVTCTTTTALDALASSSITLLVSVSSAASPTVTNSATLTYSADTDTTNNLARRPTTVKQRRTSAVLTQRPLHH